MDGAQTPLYRPAAYIDGTWHAPDDGVRFAVTNPATGDMIASLPDCGAEETEAAIQAAQAAFGPWKAKTAKDRAQILRRWYELMMANQTALGELMTAEQGKPLAEAKGEIAYAASFLEWFGEEAKRVYGETIPGHQADKRIIVTKEPIGVCAAITPWNFPAAMITRKAGPALAAGCTMVVKPAEATPLSALALAELAERAGVPKGVFNVVPTNRPAEVGAALTQSPVVRKLTFTGSTRTGKLLMEQSAATVKKVSMELGGNAPLIVFDDADLDTAVAGTIASKYRNNGQTCVCANRIYVQAGIHDRFVDTLVEQVAAMTVGNGMEDGVVLGPLINQAAVEKVENHVADAKAKGGRVVLGGSRHALGGTFFQPTIIADVTEAMAVSREETFGPVAPIYRFEDEDDAIRQANATEFGLAAYFFTRDYQRMFRTAEALEYGIVGMNTGIISTEVAPFGGVKESGIGREGSHHGIEEFLEVKYLCVGGV